MYQMAERRAACSAHSGNMYKFRFYKTIIRLSRVRNGNCGIKNSVIEDKGDDPGYRRDMPEVTKQRWR